MEKIRHKTNVQLNDDVNESSIDVGESEEDARVRNLKRID